jgi:2-aminoadipate transaminase
VVYEVVKDGFLDRHIPSIRALYKANRDAMAEALQQHLPEGCEWRSPKGGMFFWIRLPEGLDAMAMLPTAVDAGIAYVPGSAFFAHDPDPRALRLSFVTLTPDRIREGVAILGRVLNDALNGSHAPTP